MQNHTPCNTLIHSSSSSIAISVAFVQIYGNKPMSKKFDVSLHGGYNHLDIYLHFLGERYLILPLVSFFFKEQIHAKNVWMGA